MIWLSENIEFPSYESIPDHGIIAIGGDLSPERLLHAYRKGIFPWYSEEYPILWHCPSERMVLFPNELKISKSMQQIVKKGEFFITENQACEEVIYHCKRIKRNDNSGTWITDEMEQAYIKLHKLGHAKSIEVWRFVDYVKNDRELVGGLYGLEVGTVFCGESMFSRVPNTSKLAFFHLVQSGQYKLIDCQVYNDHLASLGAKKINREYFLDLLSKAIK